MKKKTLKKIKEILAAPLKIRHGVFPGRIFKDKSKYNRKQKHKKDYQNESNQS